MMALPSDEWLSDSTDQTTPSLEERHEVSPAEAVAAGRILVKRATSRVFTHFPLLVAALRKSSERFPQRGAGDPLRGEPRSFDTLEKR